MMLTMKISVISRSSLMILEQLLIDVLPGGHKLWKLELFSVLFPAKDMKIQNLKKTSWLLMLIPPAI